MKEIGTVTTEWILSVETKDQFIGVGTRQQKLKIVTESSNIIFFCQQCNSIFVSTRKTSRKFEDLKELISHLQRMRLGQEDAQFLGHALERSAGATFHNISMYWNARRQLTDPYYTFNLKDLALAFLFGDFTTLRDIAQQVKILMAQELARMIERSPNKPFSPDSINYALATKLHNTIQKWDLSIDLDDYEGLKEEEWAWGADY